MFIKHYVKPLFLALVALVGLNACAELDFGSTEQHIDPPTTVTATAISDSRIQVSWTTQSSMGAFKYYVQRATSAAGPYTHIGSVLEPETTFTAVNLATATTYFFRVVAVATDGSESVPSAPGSATTFGGAGSGGAPTGVSATAISDTRIMVSWTASPTAFKYYVQRSTSAVGAFVHVGSVLAPDTSFLDVGLTAGTTYYYQIVAVFPNNSESGPSAPPASATTFGAIQPPTNVTAQAISEDRITISWTGSANAVKYYIYRASSAAGPYANIGTALAPGSSYLDANLTPSTTYWYQLTSVDVNDSESSPSTPPVSATTFGPGGGVFEGYWKFDERTGSQAADSSGLFRTGTLSGGAAFSIADKAQIDDNRSAVAITAATSSVVTVGPAPGLNLTGSFTVSFWAKAAGGAQVRFLGMRAAGCGAPGWEIGQGGAGLYFQGENETVNFGQSLPADTWTHLAATHAGGVMRLFVNGAQVAMGAYTSTNSVQGSLEFGHPGGCPGDAFLIDETQILSRELPPSEIATAGTLPPPPASITVTAKTSVALRLSWSLVPGATSYILSKGDGAGPITFYTHVPNTGTYDVDHLTPGMTYSFHVRAVVNGLYSNPSPTVTDSTNGVLAAPTNVMATTISADRINVTWSGVTGAFKYYVFESVNNGPFTFVGSVVDPQTSLLRANLAAGSTFTYQIQAEDPGQQTSAMSASASATTP
ncbi:MAG: cell wall-binding protein [Myxococcales bacterium]|nr:cell wall-binding protein [Myxococcales bacterium]